VTGGKDRAKQAVSKRTVLPRSSDFTKKLKEIMLLLIANEAPLPAQFRDHELTGEWRDHRECHVGGDFLLVYTLDEKQNLIVFTRTGTHAELFR
jgi:mRNA interferase YafQ